MKKIISLLSFITFFVMSGFFVAPNLVLAVGGVSITPASGGANISIDTTSASGGSGTYQTLSGPTINETSAGDISVGTHTFSLPSGWEFNTGSTVTVVRTAGNIEPESQVITPGATSFTFNITSASTANSGLAFILSSMKVRPTGTVAPTTGEITHSGASILGVTNGVTSFGTLSTVPGLPTQIKIENSATGGTEIDTAMVTSGTTLTAYTNTRDRFGNFIANVATTWSLSGSTGGVTDGNLVPAGDNKSAVFTGNLVGTTAIQAVGSFTDTTGLITVVPGPASASNSTVVVDKGSETVSSGSKTVTVTVTVKDAAGNVIPGATVNFGATGSSNNLNPASVTTDGIGVATAVLTSTKAESKTVSATANSTLITQTQSVTFVHDVASQLSITQQPSTTATAGVIFVQQPVINVLDQFSNLVTDSSAVITATRSSGSGTQDLKGATTPPTATAVSGVATFSGLKYEEAVTISITFTNGSLTSVTSGSINVSPNIPNNILFTTSPSASAGSTVDNVLSTQPIAQVTDQYGNNVANGTSVTLSLATGAGALRGTLTLSTTGGTATFSGIGYNKTDAFTITATSGSVSVTSGSVGPLLAGIINAFTLGAVSPEIAGTPFGVSVSGAVDQYGNSASGTVTVSAFSGGGVSPNSTAPTFGPITVTSGAGSANTTLVNAVNTVLRGTVGLVTADTGSITVNPAIQSKIILTSSKNSINADGSDSVTMTAELQDQFSNNNLTSGVSIAFVAPRGTIVTSPILTDGAGQAVTTFNSGSDRNSGDVIVTASSAGLTSGTKTITFVDVTAPIAPTISVPTTPIIINISNKSSQVISGTTEAGATVKIYVDGVATTVTKIATGGGTFAFTNAELQTAGIVSGADYSVAKIVTVKATDTALNESSASNSISYVQDTLAPSISSYTLNGSGQNVVFNPGSVTIVLNANEPVTWTSAKIYKSDNANIYKDKFPIGDGTNTTTFSWDGTVSGGAPLADGEYIVKVHIRDSANNDVDNLVLSPYRITVDRVAPTVALTYSANPAKAGAMTITATYSESIVGTPQISINQPGTTDITNVAMTATADPKVWTYSYTVNTADGGAYVDGPATVGLSSVTDAALNPAGAPSNSTFTIDTTVPSIDSLTAPLADAVYKISVPVQFTPNDTASGAVTCAYAINGGSAHSFACVKAVPIDTTISTSGFAEGRNTLALTVIDAAGNSTTSSSVSFVVDTNNTLTVGAAGADFTTIQSAINKATAGDTVSVVAGTYAESVILDKDVSVVGAGVTTIINPAADQNGFLVTADGATIQNLKIILQTSGVDAQAIRLEGADSITISGNTIETTGNKGVGIWVGNVGFTNSDDLTISNNVITIANESTGIYAEGGSTAQSGWSITGNAITANLGNPLEMYDVTNSTVSGNTLTTTASGGASVIWTSELASVANLVFTNNIVNGSNGSQIVIGTDLKNAPLDPGNAFTGSITTVSITGNTFSNWGSRALRIGKVNGTGTVTAVTVSTNKFLSSGQAINNLDSSSISAVSNWWGSITGPSHSSNTGGIGSSVSDLVNFSPWCTNDTCSPTDSTAPSATLTGTPANPTNQTSIDVTVSGDAQVIYYEYKLDGGSYSSATALATHIILNGLGDGSHTLYVIGRDQAGNWQAEGSATTYTWTVDTGAPTTAVTSPAGGGSYNGDIGITATASDASGIARVEFWHSTTGDTLISTDTSAPYTATWHSTDTGEGSHSIYVRTYDNAGNMTQSASVAVILDRTAPGTTLAINPLTPNGTNGWYITSAPTITLTCADQTGLSGCNKIYYKWDSAVSYTEYSGTISPAEGTHILHYYSIDNAGNSETAITGTAIKVDTTNPALVLGSLFTGQTLTGGLVYPINWTTSDANLGATPVKLEYSIDDGAGTWLSIIANTENDGSYSWSVPTGINSSSAKIKITTTDLASNSTNRESSEFTVAYSSATDTTPPVVTLNSPNGAESWVGGSSHVITWTATDNVTSAGSIAMKLEYSTDGSVTWHSITASTDNDGAYLWTVPDSATTNALVKVTATDAASVPNSGSDLSNAVFTITATPAQICVDAGGGNWTCGISLNAGWNLISLPVIVSNTAIGNVLSGLTGYTIQYYDNVTGLWKTYNGSVGDLTTIEDGKGYWINMTDSATLTVTGTKAPAAPAHTPTYSVLSGWNLIGFKSTISQSTPTYLQTLPASSYTLLDASNENKNSGNMDSGKGYWLWMNADSSIVTYSE